MRRIHTGVLLASLAMVGMVAAGCNSDAKSPNTSSSSSSSGNTKGNAEASATLRDAVSKLQKTSSNFTMTLSGDAVPTGTTISGSLDPSHKLATMNMHVSASGQTLDMSYILRSDGIYIKITGMAAFGDKWMHID